MFRFFRKNDPAPEQVHVQSPQDLEIQRLLGENRHLKSDLGMLRKQVYELKRDRDALLRTAALAGEEMRIAHFTRDRLQKWGSDTLEELRSLRRMEKEIRAKANARSVFGTALMSLLQEELVKLCELRGEPITCGPMRTTTPPPADPQAGADDDVSPDEFVTQYKE